MPPLISLHNITVSTAAGIKGCGFAEVRYLDNVSLDINESEFVIVRSNEQRERHTLLRVLAGDARITRQQRGHRHAVDALVIRNGFVPGDMMPHLVREWYSAPRGHALARYQHEAWLYLLRATPASTADADPTQWLVWLRQLMLRQGSVVVTAETSMHPPLSRPQYTSMVREPTPEPCECRQSPRIRLLQLGYGRITDDVHLPECARCRQPASPRSALGS